jgi:hypothetical protein
MTIRKVEIARKRTLSKNSEEMTTKEKYMGKLEGSIALITGLAVISVGRSRWWRKEC